MKPSLRRELRTKRRALPAREHARRSFLACLCISRLAAFKAGARVAIYLPFDGETSTEFLRSAAARRGVRLYVPVVVDTRHRRITFHPLTGRMRRGVFGIAVPRRSGTAVGARWFDLIVVPLAGIDGRGRRLGMGGGFYDRALGFRRTRARWRGPHLVGLAFDCQRVDDVFADPWDAVMDSVATESGLEFFLRKGGDELLAT